MEIIQTKIKKVVKVDFRASVKKIAESLGVSRQTVYNWKNGKNFPTPENMKKLEEL